MKITLGHRTFEKMDAFEEFVQERHEANIKIVSESEKAIQIHVVDEYDFRYEETDEFEPAAGYDFTVWLPKSQITISEDSIELPEWLVKKNELRGVAE